jgi:general secretion pathway protein H
MTLLEILVVLAIMMLATSGLSFSVGALSRTNLRAGAGKLASAVRFAYNRALTHSETVRVHFTVPGGKFSIEEAHHGVTLARNKDKTEKHANDDNGKAVASIDPWAAAKARLLAPTKPTVGASPFTAISNDNGKAIARYTNVTLGRGVQFLKLIVAHEPTPLTDGDGAVHFFPGGRTEHAVIQLGDGRGAVYSVEIHPLTGRVHVHPDAYEPHSLMDNPDEPPTSEVEAP